MMQPGDSATASLVVGTRDLASALALSPDDQFPQVFSTSRMIALMEIAAARAMRSQLQEGQLSVGVRVNIRHFAATPCQNEVTATATFLGMEGKLYRFRIEAHDAGGMIGDGEHTRAIIDCERLEQGAAKRVEA
jgi:fluoroacetyl-CoA thioesterase